MMRTKEQKGFLNMQTRGDLKGGRNHGKKMANQGEEVSLKRMEKMVNIGIVWHIIRQRMSENRMNGLKECYQRV